ncbi:beta-ketoacyl synthase chain length factor [Neisseria musculi]|nr:beta-ketoacyl synthase chain length factor [Neisseria musculi]
MAGYVHFSFNIAAWRALSSKMAQEAQWRQWAHCPQIAADLPDYRPGAAFLPAAGRRRLNFPARLMCEAGWDLAERFPDAPLVYASHDGEINRSFELWLQLWRDKTVSPTSFGLSVHNALPGLWSVLRSDMREHTALALGSGGFENALAECCALLAEGVPAVLLIAADDPLSAGYPVAAERAPFPYALAMVLAPGGDYRLVCQDAADAPQDPYWGALDWIRFMLSGTARQQRNYPRQSWLWCRNGG